MGVPITFHGLVYTIPVQGDTRWGPELTRYLIALGTYGATLGSGTLGASIIPITNASGQLISSAVTATTLSFLDATSSIQTQLNAITGSGITALTGDGTATGPGSVPLTLATVNSSIGSFTLANITVNAKGLITAASNGSFVSVTSITGTANQVIASSPTGAVTLSLPQDIGTGSSPTFLGLTLTGLTANRILTTNGSDVLTSSSVTTTTLAFLDATSSIQTQLNGKQATLTIGNLTDVGTDGIVVTGGTGAVIGSGTSLAQHVADTTHNGYLSSTDWNTFNGKQATLTGTANEIIITGTTLSTPQAIATTSTPSFAGLTLTGQLKEVDGSAAVPSYGFSSNTDVGMYVAATEELAFSSRSVPCLSLVYGPAGSGPSGNSAKVYAGGVPLTDSAFSEVLTAYRNTDGTANINLESSDIVSVNEGQGSARLIAFGSVAGVPSAMILGTFGSGGTGVWWTAGPVMAGSCFIEAQAPTSTFFHQGTGGTPGPNMYFWNENPSPVWFWEAGGAYHSTAPTELLKLSTTALTTHVPLAMSSNKITGLANGTASSDAAAFGQIPTITAGQIVGTATNDTATAGNVGEYVESVISTFTNFPTPTGRIGDLTSISLTAGDWDVTAIGFAKANGATVIDFSLGISTTAGNSATGLVPGSNRVDLLPPTAASFNSASVPSYRISLASTTTVYFKCFSDYSVATPQLQGRLSARRMR